MSEFKSIKPNSGRISKAKAPDRLMEHMKSATREVRQYTGAPAAVPQTSSDKCSEYRKAEKAE
jgi:hypothetical protein